MRLRQHYASIGTAFQRRYISPAAKQHKMSPTATKKRAEAGCVVANLLTGLGSTTTQFLYDGLNPVQELNRKAAVLDRRQCTKAYLC
jgi:hypothetical protein